MQQPTSQDGNAGSELRSDAQQLGSTAANRLHSEVDARKDTAVSQAQSVSAAISQAAEGLDESSPEWLKSAFRQGAQQVQRFADTVEQKDSRELMSDAQSFARSNPGTFLAACAAVGFAAARVLKAGGAQQGSQSLDTQPQVGAGQSSGENRPFGGAAGSVPTGGRPAYEPTGSGSDAGARTRSPGEFA